MITNPSQHDQKLQSNLEIMTTNSTFNRKTKSLLSAIFVMPRLFRRAVVTPHLMRGPAAILIVIGVLLMALKIYADSEPGAIPLILVLIGLGGLAFSRFSRRNTNVKTG
jgi:hypothetical protein